MYERFTDRARRVITLAKQEAQRLSHGSIGTEQILLGLIDEGTGVAVHVLKILDADLQKIQIEVEKNIQPGREFATGEILLAPQAEDLIEFAWEESRQLKHNYVGTEHLLIAMLHKQDGIAGRVLMNEGLNRDKVRGEIVKLLGNGIE